NIECSKEILDELESAFRFNDAVLRHLTLTCKAAVTEKSAMMMEVEREESAKSSDRRPAASENVVDEPVETVEASADTDEAEPAAATEVIAENETDAEVEASKLEEEVN
ncbi:MAG: 30S ribosomal protein S6, partial [Gammaproteobacteria bacterium]|nr:30S ribosomal protein S6 [Gammaproteobacteria bacterium]